MGKTLQTSRLGEITYDESEVFYFEQGIPGFEQYKNYVFIQPDPELPLMYLQSVDDAGICFVTAEPFLFFADYEFKLDNSVKQELELETEKDVAVYCILSIQDNLKDATANLLAPILVNTSKKRGKQVVLHHTNYQTKHRLFPKE